MKSLRFTLISLAWLALVAICLPSCTCSDGKRYLPAISGKAGEVVVVADKPLWNSEVGATIREILTKDYPYLPQAEPSFDLINITCDGFSGTFSIHRNIIVVDVDAKHSEAKISPQSDVWASPQLVVRVSGPDIPSVVSLLNQKKDYLWSLVEQAEVDRQTSNARKYGDEQLRLLVEKHFGISLYIPDGYHQNPTGTEATDFLWFGYDTNFASTGIFVYSYPYTDTAQFSAKALNTKREEFLKKYVPSSREGSYMITNPYLEPEYTATTYKGMFMGRMRGLWEVHNGFMGGPFVSYSVIVGNSIVTVEGYVYAPKTEKRNYVRQVVGIVQTIVPDKPVGTAKPEEK